MGEDVPHFDDEEHFPQLSGDLFVTVQEREIFPDSKTFVDAVPTTDPGTILATFREQREDPDFDLEQFVREHFTIPEIEQIDDVHSPETMAEYVDYHWESLTESGTEEPPYSTRMELTRPYVMPGSRFREMYYWDCYFTAVGLAVDDRYDLIEDMTANMATIVDRYGHVPNGTRVYYLSRSQPPFFYRMVDLLAAEHGTEAVSQYLPALADEHEFWMIGRGVLNENHPSEHRVVRLDDGSVLNRYWDALQRPRQESYREDVEIASRIHEDYRPAFYREIRAAAESGWDFSSRWLAEPRNLDSIRTTEVVPIDLNALLWEHERKLADWFGTIGDAEKADAYEAKATERRDALQTYCWDGDAGYFFDYHWPTGERTNRWTLAAVVPLFVGLATEAQAEAVATTLREEFLQPGGLVTTLQDSPEQWDWPQGWPPLQYMATEGLEHYGYDALAEEIATRWLALNQDVYDDVGVLMEKYDVVAPGISDDAGEYDVQVGFGWTNGVLKALADRYGVPGD
jgi:alpha,alpha-trehalase